MSNRRPLDKLIAAFLSSLSIMAASAASASQTVKLSAASTAKPLTPTMQAVADTERTAALERIIGDASPHYVFATAIVRSGQSIKDFVAQTKSDNPFTTSYANGCLDFKKKLDAAMSDRSLSQSDYNAFDNHLRGLNATRTILDRLGFQYKFPDPDFTVPSLENAKLLTVVILGDLRSSFDLHSYDFNNNSLNALMTIKEGLAGRYSGTKNPEAAALHVKGDLQTIAEMMAAQQPVIDDAITNRFQNSAAVEKSLWQSMREIGTAQDAADNKVTALFSSSPAPSARLASPH